MASVYPFRAWRPRQNEVKEISSPPYDVVSSEEARDLAEDNPKSFLHVIRPEIDLPSVTPFNDEEVYAKGAKSLHQFMEDGLLAQEQESCLYLYRLEWSGNIQTGLFCCVSVEEYDEIIVKHELTRPAKEDDRTKHILMQQAHAEPVMLTYNKKEAGIKRMQNEIVKHEKPLFDFEASDGVKHTLWKLPETNALQEAFKAVSHFYIADGHHRCASASRASHKLRKENQPKGEFNYFPAVIFPSSQMHILAYNRLIHRLPDNFTEELKKHFDLQKEVSPTPQKKGQVSLYLNESWFGIELPKVENANAAEKLDVYRLQEFLLQPLLNISDPRRDENISFIGGNRGAEELERQVDSGNAESALSMYPTSIEELIAVSDEGLLMPPKSTWFEPKLRSGLLVHTF